MSDKPSFTIDTFEPDLDSVNWQALFPNEEDPSKRESLIQSHREAVRGFLQVINNCDIVGILDRTGYLFADGKLYTDKAEGVAKRYLLTHNQDSVSSAVVELLYSSPSEIEEKLANLIAMMILFRDEAKQYRKLEAEKWFNIPLHYLPTEILVGVTEVIENFVSPVEA